LLHLMPLALHASVGGACNRSISDQGSAASRVHFVARLSSLICCSAVPTARFAFEDLRKYPARCADQTPSSRLESLASVSTEPGEAQFG
jgi:hypothetical protein